MVLVIMTSFAMNILLTRHSGLQRVMLSSVLHVEKN